MRIGWLFALSILTAPALAGATPVFDSRDGVIFPANRARELLQQCSRGVPQNVTGTWQPSEAQIGELEIRLPEALVLALNEKNKRYHEGLKLKASYYRQYGGLIVKGRKLIYISAGALSFVNEAEHTKWLAKYKHRLYSNKYTVCDGGALFWGAVYDPERKTFEDFQFNGVA